jgi:hypothetical protein
MKCGRERILNELNPLISGLTSNLLLAIIGPKSKGPAQGVRSWAVEEGTAQSVEREGQPESGCHAPQPRRPVQTAQARTISPCRDSRPRKSPPRAPARPPRRNLFYPSRAPGRPAKSSLEADGHPTVFKSSLWPRTSPQTASKILFCLARASGTAGGFFFASPAHPADLKNDFPLRPDTRLAPRIISRSRRSAVSPGFPPKGRSRARRNVGQCFQPAPVRLCYPLSGIGHLASVHRIQPPASSIQSAFHWLPTPHSALHIPQSLTAPDLWPPTLSLAPNPACWP